MYDYTGLTAAVAFASLAREGDAAATTEVLWRGCDYLRGWRPDPHRPGSARFRATTARPSFWPDYRGVRSMLVLEGPLGRTVWATSDWWQAEILVGLWRLEDNVQRMAWPEED